MDLLKRLPPVHEIDALIDYYFRSCNWIYRHVHQPSFLRSWNRIHDGETVDAIVVGTASAISAVALCYMPFQYGSSTNALKETLNDVTLTVLHQHAKLSTAYSLGLVEMLLIRSHYLTLSEECSDEIWAVKNEVLKMATAIGLHQDPITSEVDREEAERRRWAWWHIMLLDR